MVVTGCGAPLFCGTQNKGAFTSLKVVFWGRYGSSGLGVVHLGLIIILTSVKSVKNMIDTLWYCMLKLERNNSSYGR